MKSFNRLKNNYRPEKPAPGISVQCQELTRTGKIAAPIQKRKDYEFQAKEGDNAGRTASANGFKEPGPVKFNPLNTQVGNSF